MQTLFFKSYRKLPIVIKAAEIHENMLIETEEGTMEGRPGDYLIIGIQGERYPCKPDIFKATYEEIDAVPQFATVE
jgi:hypothetical protein